MKFFKRLRNLKKLDHYEPEDFEQKEWPSGEPETELATSYVILKRMFEKDKHIRILEAQKEMKRIER